MTPDKNPAADQKTTIERLLDDEQVLVHLNPAAEGVIIPPHLSDNRTVTLRLSRFFKGALSLDSEKVTAELLFGPEYFTCVLPWDAIWGASSIRGQEYVWPESAPDEVIEMFLSHRDDQMRLPPRPERFVPPPAMKPKRAASHLRRVK